MAKVLLWEKLWSDTCTNPRKSLSQFTKCARELARVASVNPCCGGRQVGLHLSLYGLDKALLKRSSLL